VWVCDFFVLALFQLCFRLISELTPALSAVVNFTGQNACLTFDEKRS